MSLSYVISGLQTTSINSTSASISWSCSPTPLSYQVSLFKYSGTTAYVEPAYPVTITISSVTFSGLSPGSIYLMLVSGCSVMSGQSQSTCGVTGELKFSTSASTSVCTTTILPNDSITYGTDRFSVTIPTQITSQIGNTYALTINPSTHVMDVTGVPCGSAGTIDLQDAQGCVYTLDYKMPMCNGQTVAAPINFTIDKLVCSSFQVSWEYGQGDIPPTISCHVYNEVTGAILYDNTAWSKDKTYLNSIDLGITVNPLDTIAVKISTGSDPILLLFSDFYIPDCQPADCQPVDCSDDEEFHISPMFWLFIALVVVIYILLKIHFHF